MEIFGLILIIAVYVSYRVAKNKGYSGFLFGIGAFLFPVLALIVFALPDKSQAAKREAIDRAFDESFEQQQRKIDEMSARIKELEKQQQAPAQPAEEASEAEEKPAQPEPEDDYIEPVEREFAGRKFKLNVEDEGEMADLIVELDFAEKWYREEHYVMALPYFRKGAKAGHLRSQMYYAQMLYHGQGCEVNYEKALFWYERAAEQGEPVAQGNCYAMYKEGEGCEVNLEKALYWKEKQAEQGDDEAQFWVGTMYELGQGCEIDLEKARYWYEKSAAQGNADAQKLLDGMQ